MIAQALCDLLDLPFPETSQEASDLIRRLAAFRDPVEHPVNVVMSRMRSGDDIPF